jgi:hypothetical protein
LRRMNFFAGLKTILEGVWNWNSWINLKTILWGDLT